MEQGRASAPLFLGPSIEKVNEFFPHKTIRHYFVFLSQID